MEILTMEYAHQLIDEAVKKAIQEERERILNCKYFPGTFTTDNFSDELFKAISQDKSKEILCFFINEMIAGMMAKFHNLVKG
jgi:hypothetical protein